MRSSKFDDIEIWNQQKKKWTVGYFDLTILLTEKRVTAVKV